MTAEQAQSNPRITTWIPDEANCPSGVRVFSGANLENPQSQKFDSKLSLMLTWSQPLESEASPAHPQSQKFDFRPSWMPTWSQMFDCGASREQPRGQKCDFWPSRLPTWSQRFHFGASSENPRSQKFDSRPGFMLTKSQMFNSEASPEHPQSHKLDFRPSLTPTWSPMFGCGARPEQPRIQKFESRPNRLPIWDQRFLCGASPKNLSWIVARRAKCLPNCRQSRPPRLLAKTLPPACSIGQSPLPPTMLLGGADELLQHSAIATVLGPCANSNLEPVSLPQQIRHASNSSPNNCLREKVNGRSCD